MQNCLLMPEIQNQNFECHADETYVLCLYNLILYHPMYPCRYAISHPSPPCFLLDTIFINVIVFLKVMEHSDRNKMTAPNLAVVFGPNLMWPADKAASLSALSQINSFITTLLYNYKDIFTRELSSTEQQ